MAQTESNEYVLPPDEKKLSWSWKAAIFYAFFYVRQSRVADTIFALEATRGDYIQEILGILSGMLLAGCFIGFISDRFPYNGRFNWRAAIFAVLFYGRHFGGGANAEDIINQCIAQDGNGRMCKVHIVNTAATLCFTCFAGYFFEFIVTAFARGQHMTLSQRTIVMGRLYYFTYSGLFGDVLDIIFNCFSKEKSGWHVTETVSGLFLTYFVGPIVGDLPRYYSFLSHQVERLDTNSFHI